MIIQEKIWSMNENWDVLKPYLNNKEVVHTLNTQMELFCEMQPHLIIRPWSSSRAPWEYTSSSYWHDRIYDAVENDEQYQKEYDALLNKWFYKIHGKTADIKNSDLWDEVHNDTRYHKRWMELGRKYCTKHSPKRGTIDWYQFKHGCHWINVFAAKLIEKALKVETDIWRTENHTVVKFEKDGVIYYADILKDWDNIEKLYDFMNVNPDVSSPIAI